MPRVSILRREASVRPTEVGHVEEAAAVTYATPAVAPRTVYLPLEGYREATVEELALDRSIKLQPRSDAAREVERKAIAQDIAVIFRRPQEVFDL